MLAAGRTKGISQRLVCLVCSNIDSGSMTTLWNKLQNPFSDSYQSFTENGVISISHFNMEPKASDVVVTLPLVSEQRMGTR